MDKSLIERRLKTARGYRLAADALSQKLNAHLFGPTTPVLMALSFEIYLKCCAAIDEAELSFGHRYADGWSGLSQECREAILTTAQSEMTTNADYSDIQTILRDTEKAFIHYRYDYECFEQSDETKRNFAFHPNEIEGLMAGCDAYIIAFLTGTSPA